MPLTCGLATLQVLKQVADEWWAKVQREMGLGADVLEMSIMGVDSDAARRLQATLTAK